MHRLAELSGPLTLEVVSRLESGTAEFEPQEQSLVTLSPKIGKDDGIIDWSQSATEIDCQIRAMQPWPKATTTLHSGGTTLRCILVAAVPLEDATTKEPGAVVESGRRLLIATGLGVLEIVRIQPQGKQEMDGAAFVNGYRVTADSQFGS
jgi:methionyl-tRNA formyltransferase